MLNQPVCFTDGLRTRAQAAAIMRLGPVNLDARFEKQRPPSDAQTLASHLKSVETSGPDETAFRSIAFRFSERIVDGTIRDLVIAIDIVGRYRIDFTTTRDCYPESTRRCTRLTPIDLRAARSTSRAWWRRARRVRPCQ
jgi:hypothetical protein